MKQDWFVDHYILKIWILCIWDNIDMNLECLDFHFFPEDYKLSQAIDKM